MDLEEWQVAPLLFGLVEKFEGGTGPNSLKGIYETAKKNDANAASFGEWLLEMGVTEKIVRFDNPEELRLPAAFITPMTKSIKGMEEGDLVAVIVSQDKRGFYVVDFGVTCPKPKCSVPGFNHNW